MKFQFSDMLKQSLETTTVNRFGVASPLDSSNEPTQSQFARSSAPASTNTSSGFSEFEQQVVALTNQIRAQNGLTPLTLDLKLNASAEAHSQDMAIQNYFSHQGRNGSLPWDRMRSQGYTYSRAAENIAFGQSTPEQVVNDWMNSEGHRRNILDPNLKDIGVGYYNGYWTQNFGTLMSAIA